MQMWHTAVVMATLYSLTDPSISVALKFLLSSVQSTQHQNITIYFPKLKK